MPVIFPLHMAASALALVLLPLMIATRHKRHLHRPIGRALGVFVAVGGLTALPVAVLSSSGEIARAGFFVQGLVWLALFTAGWRAIRAKDISRHTRMMFMMAAVTTGAVWFRLITGTALLLHLPFEPMYALAAWAGWLVPLAAVWVWTRPAALRHAIVFR